MKHNYFIKILFFIFLISNSSFTYSQLNTGSVAFTAFNVDASGDKDFALVALTDIPASSTIYITDDELDGTGGLVGSEGSLEWSTGGSIITKGTIIVFTDVDSASNPSFGVSTGSITRSGSFNPSGKEALFAYLGTSSSDPTTFLAGIRLGNDTSSIGDISNSGLTLGTTLLVIDNSASPDGGYYSGSRISESSFSDYITLLGDNSTNWTTVTSSGAGGEGTLAISTTVFSVTASTTTTWNGTTSAWETASNWDNGLPTATTDVVIPNIGSDPIISSGTTALTNNLTINSSTSLTINAENSLTVSGDLTNQGTLTVISDATGSGSLIASGFGFGEFTYNRYVVGAEWHLISSPTKEQDIYTFIDTDDATNDVTTSGSNNYGISPYDNNAAGSSTAWAYYSTTNLTATGTKFLPGKGYSGLRDATGTFSFNGKMVTENLTSPISVGTHNSWNLIGNPYPSFLLVSDFITTNSALLDGSFQALYVWDNSLNSGTGGYDAITGTHYIHPGQGFFVHSATGGGNVSFTTSMLSHQTGSGFLRNTGNTFSIKLYINNGNKERFTRINYEDNSSKGLDPGLDLGQFGGVSNSFNIFTKLIENDQGVNFMRQSLPNSDFENSIIPIGIKGKSGEEIIFDAEISNLPTNIKVFLEDRDSNTFTRLDEDNSEYKITLTQDVNGIGRFYLHTSANVLSISDATLENVSIYKTDNSNIRIVGLQNNNLTVKIFNILGKQVLQKTLQSNGVSDISIPNLASGVYLIQLQTEKGKLNKKIILE